MERFLDDDGVAISFRAWPLERPRAVVQIAHGVGEHSGRYAALASDLNAAGYAAYADDHRGHGTTGMEQWHGDARMLGRLGPGGLRGAERSVHAFSGVVRRRHPDAPLVLLGHSWGSFISQRLLDRHPEEYRGVVLSGSAYLMPGYLAAGDLNARFAGRGRVARAAATGAEWLSRDPTVAAAFVADPLTTLTPLQKLFGLRETLRMLRRPAAGIHPDVPVLLQVGGDDPVGGERSVRRLARAYRERSGLSDVTVRIYPGARHEIYNETNRGEVIADLVAWLDRLSSVA